MQYAERRYTPTDIVFVQVTLSSLKATHIGELLELNGLPATTALVSELLAETGGVARLVTCAIDFMKGSSSKHFDPNKYLAYLEKTSSKDLYPGHKGTIADDKVLHALSEWSLLGLPLTWSGDIGSCLSAPRYVHDTIAAVKLTKVFQLVSYFGLHTTPHEYFTENSEVHSSCFVNKLIMYIRQFASLCLWS